MIYNWQQEGWPEFKYQLNDDIENSLIKIRESASKLEGYFSAMTEERKQQSLSVIMTEEAVSTSAIEGEFMSRIDVMSSIMHQLDRTVPDYSKDIRAKGVSQMMMSVRENYDVQLSKYMLFNWHEMLMLGNNKVHAGVWRFQNEPMQIVSGSIGKEKIHFEAPASVQVADEMERFIHWFNESKPVRLKDQLNAPVRSAVAHLYFESIHPFEDGNGRIGRAISEKAIAEGLGYTPFISLSKIIESNKAKYYDELMRAQQTLEVSEWVMYFVQLVVEAFDYSFEVINWTVKKWQFFEKYDKELNSRQLKVISKMCETPVFEGGMSAKKYMSIARTSKATATRDLQQLTEMGVLMPKGGGRSVRYELKLGK